ncbi:MAG: hypothetical protein CMP23_04485 [Rickettsiales bacterium]|nr:hypothetical protein [Rickettsiales bacterium]
MSLVGVDAGFLVEGALLSFLSTKFKGAFVAGGLILMLCFRARIRYLNSELPSDLALRNACASFPPFVSNAGQFEHFPEGSYRSCCLAEVNIYGECTVVAGL